MRKFRKRPKKKKTNRKIMCEHTEEERGIRKTKETKYNTQQTQVQSRLRYVTARRGRNFKAVWKIVRTF